MSLLVRINKTFLKELAKVPAKQRSGIEHFVFTKIEQFDNPTDVPGLKKLKGYKHYYRLRFGDYRAGIRIQNEVLIFERLLHRKDIYKYYP